MAYLSYRCKFVPFYHSQPVWPTLSFCTVKDYWGPQEHYEFYLLISKLRKFRNIYYPFLGGVILFLLIYKFIVVLQCTVVIVLLLYLCTFQNFVRFYDGSPLWRTGFLWLQWVGAWVSGFGEREQSLWLPCVSFFVVAQGLLWLWSMGSIEFTGSAAVPLGFFGYVGLVAPRHGVF